MSVDYSELTELVADLGEVANNIGPFVRKAVEVSARNVRDGARGKVQGRRHFKQAASAIDYELGGGQGFGRYVLHADIGYNKGRSAGRLGNLIEYGAPNAPRMMRVQSKGKWITVPVPGGGKRPLPPGGELQAALGAEVDGFRRGLGLAGADAMKEAGL